ncbi:hydroxyisourate hydrolase [Granulicella mallensis]|uniref:5-hydroxyisourate hydrolase n=1 Tax=Granulicella mallensis (strain ATCC BAA-1857 / DSM 23137 / MP5ACTX8) TaxID=682795 RepID=G8NRV7_GRAMM|nr:hydroxyisourate hydrolase [Granulicella mallensis]AEU35070.1 hydroxyisourate hydrolase [Granulicella mallensis MP5ACTX8]
MGLSTHILDTSIGCPAANISLALSKFDDGTWREIGRDQTDADGRCKTLLGEVPLEAATYKINFATAEYYSAQKLTGLYPWIEITFAVADPAQHYHIPLLLTANGYTTYRGS